MKHYVIIGNGVAATGCVQGIRSIDKNSDITIVSGENYPVYCRPLISYYLEGKTDLEKMKYRPDDFYTENNCKVIYDKTAIGLDPDNKTVTLCDGETLNYDSLCTATGSSPFIPPMQGLENVKNKFTFMTLDDTLEIEKAVSKDSRVLIIGAGLIGLKCAEGLSQKVKSITVIDLANRVLSSILDDECAGIMKKHLESSGISFNLSESVAEFTENKAIMKSGNEVQFDILVLAVGVRPNISLIKDLGGVCGRGITVNEHMQTSLSDVFAAGDCTESIDVSSGSVKIMALMPNAFMQGFCSGVNMAGGDTVLDNSIPMNSIGFFGLHIMTAGTFYEQKEGGEVYEQKDQSNIKKLFIKDGKLTGFILIGDVKGAGIYTDLIRSQASIDTLDFELLKKSPDLFAYNSNYRQNILECVV